MIRSILLPMSDGPLNPVVRDYAFWLARKEGSQIHALAVIDVKSFEIPVLGTPDGFMPSVITPPLAETQSYLGELTSLARERLEQFAAESAAAGIRSSTETRTGIPAEVIARQAVAHDIVVMGRAGYTRDGTSRDRVDPLVSQVVRTCIRPVLVTGRGLPPGGDVRRVLLAFDGSSHAARALPVAAELGGRPGVECTVITVASSQAAGLEVIEPAEAFLYHHGLMPGKEVIIGTKASELICELVASMQADVLVMGAYGHSPVREMIFGSTTERVLSHCGTTVVLQS
ncbi:MAG: universal stress protein [Acidobacteria bacterium]|nr:universal stress protein [Acidobacteriota bacterium]